MTTCFARATALVGVLISALLTSCIEQPATPATDQSIQAVHLHLVSTETSAQVRRFPGKVEATQTAELAFRIGGELQQLPLRPGHSVAAGQLVAALDATDYAVALEQAQAKAELARAQFKRSQQMAEQALISPAAFDQAHADLKVAEANLRSARTQLSYTQLTAPFSGVIAHLHVENYENVGPQQPIMTLQLDGYIDISIQVPERLFARVRRDLDYQPEVLFDSLPETPFKARVREWDRIADPATNTYRVVFSMPAPEHINILPGMTATVLIDVNQMTAPVQNLIWVPASSLFTPEHRLLEDGIAYVWVYRAHPAQTASTERFVPASGSVSLRQLQIGEITNQGVAVSAGLEPGEYVVQSGVHQLYEGQQVRPWLRERGL